MADLLQTGSTWLEDQRHQHMTRPVTYLRGADSVALNATVGRTVFEQQDQFGVIQRTETRDYLVRAIDLVLDGAQTEPRVGDRIREPNGTGALLYEVMAPGGEPHFRFSDPERITLRIHTKLTGKEATP
ncbi:MAG: hypothetical protein H6813_02610 [Phycisphaeraceae bacterium]|nr:hypothetical protein [Phycisphaeraceae bacterium]MCB9848792.1 hypothetical protein [Phycisphaeraceae bacterium]